MPRARTHTHANTIPHYLTLSLSLSFFHNPLLTMRELYKLFELYELCDSYKLSDLQEAVCHFFFFPPSRFPLNGQIEIKLRVRLGSSFQLHFSANALPPPT